jgi:hypothetical protein
MKATRKGPDMAAAESDPVALQRFELEPEPVPGEVLGFERPSDDFWALRLSGSPVRQLLTTEPIDVHTREYVFALPLDVVGKLARALMDVFERDQGRA